MPKSWKHIESFMKNFKQVNLLEMPYIFNDKDTENYVQIFWQEPINTLLFIILYSFYDPNSLTPFFFFKKKKKVCEGTELY